MVKLKKVLLLNPPADGIYFRDLYHTFSSKASYVWQPADLLIMSGALGRAFHITVRDCIGDEMSQTDLVASLGENTRFDFIISLTGSITVSEDVKTLSILKEKFITSKVLVVGDFVREHGKLFLLQNKIIDGCILDFTAANLGDILHNWAKIEDAQPNYIIRKNETILVGKLERTLSPISIFIPHHEKFDIAKYAQPINRNLPVATVLGGVGCPFSCGFCAQGSIAFRARPPEDIFEEIKFLWELGVREVSFRDQLMEGNKRNLKQLCSLIIESNIKISWYCNSRADTLTPELIALMRDAGCHSVLMGIESADDGILRELKTMKTSEKTKSTILLLRKARIAVLGYFILGLPGETKMSIKDTIRYACFLDIDFASFSTPSPDYGTTLRKNAIAQGVIDSGVITNTDRSVEISKLVDGITPTDLIKFRQKAYRSFYFRPRTIFRLTAFLCTRPYLIGNVWRNFVAMISKQFTSRSSLR